MTTLLLIRHASHDLLGRALTGRAPDVHLSTRGMQEAERLVERLGHVPVRALYTSPLERAQETAWPLASKLQLPLRVLGGLDEVDVGEWTRKTFPELDPLPEWHKWNAERHRARCPGGESMQEVQDRIADALSMLGSEHPDDHVAIVSHGDVIKAALMHYLGMPLDCIHRFEISPASVSVVALSGSYGQVLQINETGEVVAHH